VLKWALGIMLLVGVHFSASYLVPLDEEVQETFLGLLKVAWSWAYGDHGLLGKLSECNNLPGSPSPVSLLPLQAGDCFCRPLLRCSIGGCRSAGGGRL